MRKLPSAALFLLLGTSCVTISNKEACTIPVSVLHGAICAETLTPATREVSSVDHIEWLEPKDAVGGSPARAGAVCLSFDHYNAMQTELEQACRALGSNCKKAVPKK